MYYIYNYIVCAHEGGKHYTGELCAHIDAAEDAARGLAGGVGSAVRAAYVFDATSPVRAETKFRTKHDRSKQGYFASHLLDTMGLVRDRTDVALQLTCGRRRMWALRLTSGRTWRRRDLRATVSGCRCGCCGARRRTSQCGQAGRAERGSGRRGNWSGDRWPCGCVRGRRTPWSLTTATSRWEGWMLRLKRSWRRSERTGALLLMGGGIIRWRWRK